MVGEQQVRIADDRLQHVVEVVRDAAGELADGLHLLRLGELLLELALLGGVERVEDRRLAVALGLALVAGLSQSRAERLGLAGERQIDRRDLAAARRAAAASAAASARGRAPRRSSTIERPSPLAPVRGSMPNSRAKAALERSDAPCAVDAWRWRSGVALKKRAKRTSAARCPSSTSSPGERLRTSVREAPGVPSWPKATRW